MHLDWIRQWWFNYSLHLYRCMHALCIPIYPFIQSHIGANKRDASNINVICCTSLSITLWAIQSDRFVVRADSCELWRQSCICRDYKPCYTMSEPAKKQKKIGDFFSFMAVAALPPDNIDVWGSRVLFNVDCPGSCYNSTRRPRQVQCNGGTQLSDCFKTYSFLACLDLHKLWVQLVKLKTRIFLYDLSKKLDPRNACSALM